MSLVSASWCVDLKQNSSFSSCQGLAHLSKNLPEMSVWTHFNFICFDLINWSVSQRLIFSIDFLRIPGFTLAGQWNWKPLEPSGVHQTWMKTSQNHRLPLVAFHLVLVMYFIGFINGQTFRNSYLGRVFCFHNIIKYPYLQLQPLNEPFCHFSLC